MAHPIPTPDPMPVPPSRAELPRTADAVVVGGGVNGASTAFQLARRGLSVVLVEQGQLGYGATGKSGALVRCHYTNTHEARLTLESLRVFRDWDEHVGHGDPVFQAPGFLQVVKPEDADRLRANVEALRGIGVRTEVVAADDVHEVEPLLRVDDLSVVAFEPDSGYADPNATVYGFAGAARANGAVIATHTVAGRILTEGGRVTGVETDNGTIATRTVVLAGGAWANGLLAPLGVDFGMVPRRIQVAVFRWPEEIDQRRPHRVVIDRVAHSWLRPEGTHSTIIGFEGGTSEHEAGAYDETPARDYVDAARRALASRLPAFAHATMRGGWAGMVMQSADNHPIMGRVDEVEGLVVFAGDSGSSFKTAPAAGICLAELITEGRSELVDMHPFRPSRFAEGQPWRDEGAYSATGDVLTISR
jgi:sarcosine oxidase, subunit beta